MDLPTGCLCQMRQNKPLDIKVNCPENHGRTRVPTFWIPHMKHGDVEITPEMIGEVNGKAWEQFECEGCKLDFPVEDGALCKECHTAGQAEMDKLERSDGLLGNAATALGEKWTEVAQQNKSLQAENERLREALEYVREESGLKRSAIVGKTNINKTVTRVLEA
ncbi:hypothetical protein LCGC14_2871610, partial [marine sediment metagenome]